MKIRTKLQLALGTLFLLITLLSAFAIRQVNLLSGDTKNILVANYQSLDYSRNMLRVINTDSISSYNLQQFKTYMERQVQNVTEVGEKEFTTDLQMYFNTLQNHPEDKAALLKIREVLHNIMKLNMDAIQRKSVIAEKTADNSVLWLTFTAALCISFGFLLFLNLPGAIAAPVKKLTESIRQIAEKNYSQRVYIDGRDEFAIMARSFNTMAEKLEEYTASDLAQLMTEKKRVETLINNMADPVIGLDENHNVLFVNQEALNVTALKRENIVSKNIRDVALTNDLIRDLSKEAVLGSITTREVLKIFTDGREGYFEKNIIPIQIVPTGESETKQIGSVIILRNITSHKELDTAKTNFIATVSHEFKTPIASMKMSLQLLENEKTGTLNEEQHSLIDSLRDDAERLLRTTGELLNITQVETGKALFKVERTEISAIIQNAVEANEKFALRKEIRLSTPDLTNLPEVIADAEKAEWIVSNLISNAIRYSYEDADVTVTAHATPTHLEIAVHDYGIGIDEAYHDKVFEKYFRVPGTEKEGTGLGLSISKEFIEAMGGYLHLQSDIGKGSIFTAGFKRA